MKYIGLALYSEGRTDDYFMSPLLGRLCDHLCLREATEPVEFSEVVGLVDHPTHAQASRSDRILQAARSHQGAWRILFIHGDGESDPSSARRHQVDPGIDAIRQAFGQEGIAVGVVPVRETESWLLYDGDALRTVFGTTFDNDRLHLPGSARAVEAAADPKSILNRAFLETGPRGQRLRKGVSPYLGALGEQVDLDRLQDLSSFRVLVDELRLALQALRVIG